MSIDRLDFPQAGYWVLQYTDTLDLAGNTIDFTGAGVVGLPTNLGARFGWVRSAKNIPSWGPLEGTVGVVAGWIYLPPDDHSARTVGQWTMPFAAKVTQASPLMVQPIATGSGSGWAVDTSLAAVAAWSAATGTAPAVNDLVLCVAGTYLGRQYILAFQGGGGGGQVAFRISAGSEPYTGVQIDPVTGVDVPGGITSTHLHEMNNSAYVGTGTKVYCQKETSGGTDYYVFVLPMAPCS